MEEHAVSESLPETDNRNVRVAACPNCGAAIEAPYCGSCGQLQKNLNRQIWSLLGDLLDDLVRIDSRIALTLFALLFKPGFLTTEYFAGRRARYTPPVRLYLIISFLFFFMMPGINDVSNDVQINGNTARGPIEVAAEDDEVNISVELPWLTQEENTQATETLRSQIIKARELVQEDPSAAFDALMDRMSIVMFFMLPIFAIFLKLFYLDSGVYYAEHLLLAVHNHCFLFIALLVSALLETMKHSAASVVTEPLDSILLLWIAAYMFLSLKTTFGQSIALTLFKYFMLAFVYLLLTVAGAMAALIMGVLSL